MFALRSVRYFVAVAEELHFGRAAERLRMSQPPLSQAIRQLERDVGAQLFERTNRRVMLTPTGRIFLDECRKLLRHAENVAETPRLHAGGARSRVTVGTIASGLLWPLPAALDLVRRRAPHLAMSITEIDTHEAAPALADGRIDLALARLLTARTGIENHVLLRDVFTALVPSEHPAAADQGPVDLLELADEPWIWLPREISPDYHDDMAAACRTAGFSPHVEHWAHSITSQLALVALGIGVTIVPATAAQTLPEGVAPRPVRDAIPTVALAASTRAAPTQPVQLVLACIGTAISG